MPKPWQTFDARLIITNEKKREIAFFK